MPDERGCEAIREQLAELALGIASGDQRARVLEPIAGCPRCRRLLGEFALVSDELLQLAPEHEPPPGFEVRVIERLGRPPRPRRRRVLRGPRGAALAAVAAAPPA